MKRAMVCAVVALLLMRAITACAAAREEPNVAGTHPPGETPLGVETPSAESTPAVEETPEEANSLPPNDAAVLAKASVMVTNKAGYKAKVEMTFYEPRVVDTEWARQAQTWCGALSEAPMISRPGLVVLAARIEGTMTDQKAGGLAWSGGAVAPTISSGSMPGSFPDDERTYDVGYLSGNGCADGRDQSANWVVAPFSADTPGSFRGEVLTYMAPTPKDPKLNLPHMRAIVLSHMQISVGLRDDNFDPEALDADCKTAKVQKGFLAYQTGIVGNGPCVIGPDVR